MSVNFQLSDVKQSKDVVLGYGAFAYFRYKVANAIGGNFGYHYQTIRDCYLASSEKKWEEWDKKARQYIEKEKVSKMLVNFLYQSDCNGRVSYTCCKKIVKLLKGEELSENEQALIELMKEAIANKSALEWS